MDHPSLLSHGMSRTIIYSNERLAGYGTPQDGLTNGVFSILQEEGPSKLPVVWVRSHIPSSLALEMELVLKESSNLIALTVFPT